jgi:hypothetical protein
MTVNAIAKELGKKVRQIRHLEGLAGQGYVGFRDV